MIALVFDTETTDLIENSARPLSKQPHIIEFFGQLVEDDGTVLEELEFLCDPGEPLRDVITKITKLTDADLKGKPVFGEYFDKIQALMTKADAIVAHSLSFDTQMLGFEGMRANNMFHGPEIKICTLEATMHFKGWRLSLAKLYEHLFDETFEGAHRAKVDTQALTRCYLELRKRGVV